MKKYQREEIYMGVNKVTIEGRLTRDPEIKFTASGARLCDFSIAVNHSKKVGDDWIEEPAWFFDCVAWEDNAEKMSPFKKGDPVYVEGSLRQERWEQEGVVRTKVKIQVKEIRRAEWAKKGEKKSTAPEQPPPVKDDNIPF
jgi:single-strand DNA-binding protein